MRFVRNSIDRQFRNPRSEQIQDLLAVFSDEYKDAYRDSVGEEARAALGSIMSNRIRLAHEGLAQSQLTLNDVRRYFALIVDLLEAVEKILLSRRATCPVGPAAVRN